jgi:hypothetical protein
MTFSWLFSLEWYTCFLNVPVQAEKWSFPFFVTVYWDYGQCFELGFLVFTVRRLFVRFVILFCVFAAYRGRNLAKMLEPEKHFYYFAYGSNLLGDRLRISSPSAIKVDTAKLDVSTKIMKLPHFDRWISKTNLKMYPCVEKLWENSILNWLLFVWNSWKNAVLFF